MEFGDRLRAMRKEKGVSQQALANAIYVSRSAVAKWENRLGLPSRESYEALLAYFAVSEDTFPLNEAQESITVAKNRRIRYLSGGILNLSLVLLCLLPFFLFRILENGYAFDADTAIGDLWAEEKKIETDGYIFYFDMMEGDFDLAAGTAILKKWPVGYQRIYPNEEKMPLYGEEGRLEGYLLSLPDGDGYSHLFYPILYLQPDGSATQHVLTEVTVKGNTYRAEYGIFFRTPQAITAFESGDKRFYIGEKKTTLHFPENML